MLILTSLKFILFDRKVAPHFWKEICNGRKLVVNRGKGFWNRSLRLYHFFILKAEIYNKKNFLSNWEWGRVHDEVGYVKDSEGFKDPCILCFWWKQSVAKVWVTAKKWFRILNKINELRAQFESRSLRQSKFSWLSRLKWSYLIFLQKILGNFDEVKKCH